MVIALLIAISVILTPHVDVTPDYKPQIVAPAVVQAAPQVNTTDNGPNAIVPSDNIFYLFRTGNPDGTTNWPGVVLIFVTGAIFLNATGIVRFRRWFR